MKYQIPTLKAGAWSVAVILLALGASGLIARSAAAQDDYHNWVLQTLSDLNIEGGQFLLGTNENTVLSGGAWIADNQGTSTAETIAVDPAEGLPFTAFNRYVHDGITANWYDALTRFVDVAPVETGDVALLVLLMRGENTSGGVGSVEIVFDMNAEPYTRALSTEELLNPEWTQVLIPFEMPFSRAAGGANFGLNFGLKNLQVDIAAPVVLNYGDAYTVEALEALIAAGGELPLLASFTADGQRGVPPFVVSFDASASTSPGTISSYAWDFGDGTTGSGVTTSHTYTEFGTYTVELTIQESSGATDSATRTVVVFDGRGLASSPLDVPYTPAAPEVDGAIEALWNDAVAVSLDNLVADFPPIDAADFTVEARALWDEQRLHVLYEVTDAALYNTSDATWQDDSVELYVDGGNEKQSSYDSNDGQYEIGWNATELTGTAVAEGKADGVLFASQDTGDGYVVEISVPWSSLGVEVVPGEVIGLDFMANDDDTGSDTRQTKLSWFNLQDNAWTRLDGAGNARLIGGEGAVTAAAFDVTPGEILADVPVQFDGSRSVAPSTITSYAWDFGDGTTGEGATVSHTYRRPDTYVVTLTITDASGSTDTATRNLTVIDGVGRPDKPFLIARAPSAPVIDGILDDVWTGSSATISITNVPTGAPVSGPTDLSAMAFALWDQDALYVYVDVLDDVLIANESGQDVWRDDAVEVFLDGDNGKEPSAYDENDAQFTVGYDNTLLTGRQGREGMGDGVQFASTATSGGYAVELLVPWASLQLDPVVGAQIGFEVQVNDDDDGDDRDSKLTWFDATDNAWQWAHVFATAMLVETIQVAAEDDTQLPDRFAIESIYPNPFNPAATAVVSVRQTGAYTLQVYNVLGQLVETRALDVQVPGQLEVALDFSDRASGVYFISVENRATGAVATARAMLVK